MSHLAELAKLPEWEVTYEIYGRSKPETKTVKAPTEKEARKLVEYVAKQKSNQRITITNIVRSVKKS